MIDEYGGGFIGLLRPGLYQRMLDALPEGTIRHDTRSLVHGHGREVIVHLRGRDDVEVDVLVGADGINSIVRRGLWGDSRSAHRSSSSSPATCSPTRRTPSPSSPTTGPPRAATRRSATRAGRATSGGCSTRSTRASRSPRDLRRTRSSARAGSPAPLLSLIEQTPAGAPPALGDPRPQAAEAVVEGPRDDLGDAAHPTSPYAAYGAGMSIEDGYFLAAELEPVDLHDRSAGARRAAGVRGAAQAAHAPDEPARVLQRDHVPPAAAFLRPLRDLIFDHTPLLQKVIGDACPPDPVAARRDRRGRGARPRGTVSGAR